MIRRLLIIAILCAGLAWAHPPLAEAEACTRHFNEGQAASSCGKLGWSYDPRTRRFGYGSKITASDDPDGSKFVYSLVSACDLSPDAGGVHLCANFGNCPPRVGPDGEPLRVARFQGLRAPKGPDGTGNGNFVPFGETICQYDGKSVPMGAVVAAVRDELVKEVGRPVIGVQPATRGLIRWPVLFSAPAQHQTRLVISRPLAGAITALPDYRWDLGAGAGGQPQTGAGAGHRYLASMDPRSPATDGYYVKGVYDTPGEHRVRLDLTWQASIHLGPAAGGLDVDLDPIVFTDTATARVVSATNHLYSQIPAEE